MGTYNCSDNSMETSPYCVFCRCGLAGSRVERALRASLVLSNIGNYLARVEVEYCEYRATQLAPGDPRTNHVAPSQSESFSTMWFGALLLTFR